MILSKSASEAKQTIETSKEAIVKTMFGHVRNVQELCLKKNVFRFSRL